MGLLSLFNTLKDTKDFTGSIEDFQVKLRDNEYRGELYKYVSDPAF